MARVLRFGLLFAAVPVFASDIEVISKERGVLSSRQLSHYKDMFALDSFIETGTYAGDTTFEASTVFKDVHSVEIWEPLHNKAQERFAQTPNVHLYLGDTTRVLSEMISQSAPKKLYWLDAHSSGDGTGGLPGFSPIIMELSQIYSSTDLDSVILIDDLRGMCHCDSRTNLPLRLIIQKLQQTHPTLRFYSIGDIGIIFDENTYPHISISETVKAASMSRFFDPECEDEAVLQQLIDAESIIGSIKDDSEEARKFSELTKWVDRTNLGGEVIYLLWGALQKLDQKQYASAVEDFQLVAKSFYSHWRVDAYLAKALILDGQLNKAKSIFQDKLAQIHQKHPRVLAKVIGEQNMLKLMNLAE